MERYYKTNRDSETGLKLKAILDKAKEFDKQIKKLGEKYGFTETYRSNFYFRNLDIVGFEKEPDMTIWKRVKNIPGGYRLRARCKNKEILADCSELEKLCIPHNELDKIIGNNNILRQAGFNFCIPEIYIFIVKSGWKCDIPKDCQEISNIEYEQLTSKKE